MKNWHKSNRTVKNPAQAGDAVLAFHYENFKKTLGNRTLVRETKVHTENFTNFDFEYHHDKDYRLEFWGAAKGIVEIPLTQPGSLYESLWVFNFSKEDIGLFTHVVIKKGFKGLEENVETEKIDIYRLSNVERHCITNKTTF